MRTEIAVVVVLAWLATAGCGETEAADATTAGAGGGAPVAGAGGTNGVGFEASVQPLLNLACNCHQSSPLMAPFSLLPGEAYANLVGATSTQVTAMPRVTPGRLNESYLWHKVNDTQAQIGGSGTIMPPTLPLDPAQRSTIELWIAGGAQP